MSVLGILVPLIVLGVVLWAVNTVIPMEPKIQQIVNVTAVVLVVLWLLQVFVGHTGAPVVRP